MNKIKKEEFINVVENLLTFDRECYRWEKFGIDLYDLPIWNTTMNFVYIYLENNLTSKQIDIFWDNYDVLTPEALWILLANQSSNE